MSHPCGDYSACTLTILEGMKIDIGFRSDMSVKEDRSPLEIPREDHANIFRNAAMKVTIFSGNQPRHLNLAKEFSKISNEVFCQ